MRAYEAPGKLIVKGVNRYPKDWKWPRGTAGMGAIEDMPMFERELYQAFGGADAEGDPMLIEQQVR